MNGGPHCRRSSPTPSRSTLTTSAPRSPSTIVQYGPASTREKSSTRIPSRARLTASALGHQVVALLGVGQFLADDGQLMRRRLGQYLAARLDFYRPTERRAHLVRADACVKLGGIHLAVPVEPENAERVHERLGTGSRFVAQPFPLSASAQVAWAGDVIDA